MPPPWKNRRRPPWWPEGEEWPPPGGPRFARRFVRRFVLFALGFVVLVFVLNVLSFIIFGREHGRPPGYVFGIAALVIGLTVFSTVRGARLFAQPVGQVMDAVERLAAGDYTTRVAVAGSKEVRELSLSLNQLAERLGSLEEERRNLVADVSHELRTPLSVLRGNVEGILDGIYEPEPERLQLLVDEVEVIARLIDDFQTLSLAEAGALRLHPEPANLAALVASVVSAFRERATAKGVSLTAEAPPGPEFPFDAVRMREVLENLLANALRHTPSGGAIGVTLAWPFGAAEISVADTGTGIPPEELPFVFERYRKSADSTGQGLGLPIARRLVEAHNGRIEVESQQGTGTTFRVLLPVR
jgi:two-component system sensor histidine kinase BaeS